MKKDLKDIIKFFLLEGQLEKRKLSVEEIVNKFKDRVLIFFDTETTGLYSRKKHSLITEIAALAIDTSTGQEIGRYSMKSKLTPEVEQTREKQRALKASGELRTNMPIDDILKMTGYEDGDIPYEEEGKVLEGFVEFIKEFKDKNPVMVAHNASFDMRQINDALKQRHRMPFLPKYPVLDTLALVRNYLQPLLLGLEEKRGENEEIDRLLKTLRPEKKFVSKLSVLGLAFEVGTEHWHSAVADAKQLSGILAKIITFFETHGGSMLSLGLSRMPIKSKQDKGKKKPPVNQP